MKASTLFKLIVPVLVLALALSVVTPAQTASSGPDGKVRVWVEFVPGTAVHVEKAILGAQAEVHYRFDSLNAFVISVPQSALEGLARNPNVVSIEEDVVRYAFGETVPYGIDMVTARDVWDSDRNGVVDAGAPTGSGRTICIIDSGLYTGHEDFAGVNILGGYPTGWNTDTCGHGTHVAGTIAAQFANDRGVVGVTPGDVSLYIVKVFGDNCAWTYSSTLVDAANRCAAAGANIISMSLGGPTKSTTESRAFNTLYTNGILPIAAAGNDGTTALNYPAGYTSVVSVAAIDDTKTVADFSQYNSDVELAAPGVGVLSTIPYVATDLLTVSGVTYDASHIEYAAYGTATGALVDGGLCTTTGAWGGKIVLCQRGDISFYDKVKNVQDSGGAGAVIYNNVDGELLATLGEGYSSTIPAITLTMADGQYLVANKLGSTATLQTSVVWGVSGYEAWDGTSMATPHVSAVAALIWSADPSKTNADIRTAMTSTAEDLGAAGRDVYYGYGLVRAYEAWQALGGGGGGGGGALAVTVTTNKASYINRETVAITVTVKDDAGAPVAGAAVSVALTTANGTKLNYSGTTNTSGVASFSYKVTTNKHGTGTYSLSATATMDGYTAGTGTATFLVTK